MYLFSLQNTKKLTQQICAKTKFKLGQYQTKRLADGELYLQIKNKIKGQNVYVLGSTNQPNDNLVEFLILINALKVNGAKKITAIIPYFGYSRQDKVDKPGAPITAKLIADLLKQAGVKNFITVDIHSQRDKKYLQPNLINLDPLPIFSEYLKKKITADNTIVVAPDNGATDRAKKLAILLDPLPVIVMKKYRPQQNIAKVKKFQQNIKGKNIIITDDMVDTAGTIYATCQELKRHQVKDIYVCATHGIFSNPAKQRLSKAPIKQIIITDTLPQLKKMPKLKILSIKPLLIKNLK